MKKILRLLPLLALVICFVSFYEPEKTSAASYAKTITLKLKDGQDATNEIQNALDEAAKTGTAKKQVLVTVPAGTYYISHTLVIGSNTHLKLDKKTYIKKNQKAKDPILHMLHTKQGSKGKYADNSNITVEGGVWDTEFIHYNDKTSGSIFMFAHTTKLKILNVTLRNSFGTHLIELGGVKNCTISGCTLYGFKAPDAVEKEAIQLDVCHSQSIIDSAAPYDDSPCTNITITKCEIHDYSRAVGSHMMVEGIYHKKIKITNNNFHDITEAAVYGYNYADVTIKGNTFKNIGCGIQLKTDSVAKNTILTRNSGVKAMSVSKNKFKIKIIDNTITLANELSDDKINKGTSMGIFIYGSDVYPMKDATIKDNTITCNSSGIYLRYVNDTTISGNYIDRHQNAFSVDKTTFAEDAIKLLDSSNAAINGNHISTKTSLLFENGIALREGSKNVTVSDNEVTATVKSGIGIYESSSITGGSGNTFRKAGLNGLTIKDSSVKLSTTTISDSSEHGISMTNSSTLELNDCKITNSGSNGINIASGCKVTINKGEIVASGGKGVNVMDSGSLNATELYVSKSGGKGIDIGGNSTNVLNGCYIFSNTANGVFVDGDNSDTTIKNCKIYDNSGNALQLKNGKVHVDSNEFTNNCLKEADGKAVMVFSGIKGEITNNTFSNPNVKSELWLSSGVSLSPYLSTMKRDKSIGLTDAGGNYYR